MCHDSTLTAKNIHMNDPSKKYILAFLILVAALFIGISVFFVSRETSESLPKPTQTVPTLTEADKPSESLAVSTPEKIPDTSFHHISNDDIVWHNPREIKNSPLLLKRENEASEKRLVTVGEMKTGEWTGGKVYILISWDTEWRGSSSLSTIIEYGEKFYFTLYREPTPEELSDITRFDNRESEKSRLIARNERIIIDGVLPPETITDSKTGAVFHQVEYGDRFFDERSMTKAFTSDEGVALWWGKTTPSKPRTLMAQFNTRYSKNDTGKVVFEAQNYFATGAAYAKLPDGTTTTYVMSIPFLSEKSSIPNITWNDGTRNETSYQYLPGGCGIRGYMIGMAESVPLGKKITRLAGQASDKSPIYEYSDGTSETIKNLYKNSPLRKKNAGITMEDFLDMHPIVFWQDPYDRVHAFYNNNAQEVAECGKPVIYLYPEKPTDVSVRVSPAGGLSISDPEYGDGWNVRAYPDGRLLNLGDGKEYGSLFWEGKGAGFLPEQPEGFTVSRDDLSALFEQVLPRLGLQGREISEFEEFWIPEMRKKADPYFFVTFYSPKLIDHNAPLSVSPQPDTVIRVLMDYEGRKRYEKTVPQRFVTPKRNGFTVVEWGGVLHR